MLGRAGLKILLEPAVALPSKVIDPTEEWDSGDQEEDQQHYFNIKKT